MPSLEPCSVHTAGRGEAPERSVKEVTVNLCTYGIRNHNRLGAMYTFILANIVNTVTGDTSYQ